MTADTQVSEALKDDELRSGPGLGSRISARFKRAGLVDPLPELRGHVPLPADLPT